MYSEFDLEILENQIANFTNAFPTSNMHQIHAPVYEQITPPQSPNGMKSVSGNRKRRPRTTFTPNQILSLETEFSINNHLTRHRKIVIARALNLEEKQVNVWFQNRRMKAKKLAEKEKVVTGSPQVVAPIDPIYPQLSVEEIKKRLIAVEQIPGLVHHPLEEEPKTDYTANNIISNETNYYNPNTYSYIEYQIAPSSTESDCSVFDNQSFELYENGNVQIESDLSNQSDSQVGDNNSFVFCMNENVQVSPSNEAYLDTTSEELQELLNALHSNHEIKSELNPEMEKMQDFTSAFLNL